MALLLMLAIVAWNLNQVGIISAKLTFHCKTFIESQPESRLTYPGGVIALYASGEGVKSFNEVDDPYSVAYIDIPAAQEVVDAWYQSWVEAHGWSPFEKLSQPNPGRMTASWVRRKDPTDNNPTASLEFASWPADQDGDASHPADPSQKGITTVQLKYKVLLHGEASSTLCS